MTTTSYGTFVNHCPDRTGASTLHDYVENALGEYAHDYDTEGLADAYRDAINEQLELYGVSMHGDEFYGPHPVVDVDIAEAFKAVDFWALAAQYDQSTPPA
jgi:hypothetical protein